MRILMLLKYPLYGSGSGTYTRMLAEKLAELHPNDQIAVFCPDDQRSISKRVTVFPFQLPFPVASTGHPDWPKAKRFFEISNEEVDRLYTSALAQVLRVVNQFQPDVIHVQHELYFTWIANYLRAIYGIYYLVTVHGTGLLTASQDKRWIPLTRDGLSRAWLINAVSNDTKKWLLRVYNSAEIRKKIRIIPGGVDLEAFQRNIPIRIINKKYNLTDKKVVVYTGKLTQQKGVAYLVKAAPKIKAEIFIIGDGEEKNRLMELSRTLKATNVHFLGYLGQKDGKELHEFYRRADVFTFPSVWDEPLGLVALEAMASSTPVVASKKGGIPLAVKNGVNGFLVRARSAKALSEKINQILRNPILQQKMGSEARRTVEERFNWSAIAQKFHRYYEEAYRESRKRLRRMHLSFDVEREQREIKGKKLDYK